MFFVQLKFSLVNWPTATNNEDSNDKIDFTRDVTRLMVAIQRTGKRFPVATAASKNFARIFNDNAHLSSPLGGAWSTCG
jgi:hypothetical protein